MTWSITPSAGKLSACQSTAIFRLPTPRNPPKSMTGRDLPVAVHDHVDDLPHVRAGAACERSSPECPPPRDRRSPWQVPVARDTEVPRLGVGGKGRSSQVWSQRAAVQAAAGCHWQRSLRRQCDQHYPDHCQRLDNTIHGQASRNLLMWIEPPLPHPGSRHFSSRRSIETRHDGRETLNTREKARRLAGLSRFAYRSGQLARGRGRALCQRDSINGLRAEKFRSASDAVPRPSSPIWDRDPTARFTPARTPLLLPLPTKWAP